jgi:hypothetical protein
MRASNAYIAHVSLGSSCGVHVFNEVLRLRQGTVAGMSRRIEIELTSALSDGSWTWRAAGARKPNGVLTGSLLPDGSVVGDVLKVEIEQMMDSIDVLTVIKSREQDRSSSTIELLPSSEPFQEVIETRAKRDRGDRQDGKDKGKARRDGRGKRDGRGSGRGDGDSRRKRPHFEAPPELPQRPKPKRLRPGKARRNAVLADLPEEQRSIAELALQGMPAVRSRVQEENVKLAAEGKPEMPEATVVKMAEDLLPKLRVAEWLDRAEAALRQMENLDLRDIRSVVAASDDPIVARDESTRAVAQELKEALVTKQAEELKLWLGDIDAALGVGRVIRALRLSSQPPKAGVMFPPDMARRLGEAATQALQPDDSGDRWIAVLEAGAFSPVRTLLAPTKGPSHVSDDLKKTVIRLGPPLPQIAALLDIEVPEGTPKPKPLRPQTRKDGKGRGNKSGGRGRRDEDGARKAQRTAKPPTATVEPAKSEPVKSEPVKSEPVKSEPVKSEAAEAPVTPSEASEPT